MSMPGAEAERHDSPAASRARAVKRAWARLAVAVTLLGAGTLLWLFAGQTVRLLCSIALVVLAVVSVRHVFRPVSRRVLALSAGALVLTALSPIDVSTRPSGGRLRVVPYVVGYPSAEAREMAERGECILAGCVAWGLEPSWLVIS